MREARDEAKRPTFQDLQDNAKTTVFRHALARYLIPKNYERSIRRHERLGTPIVRKVVMATTGKDRAAPHFDSNYRLNRSRNPLERSVHYALYGSVYNEKVHTLGALALEAGAACDFYNGGAVYNTVGVAATVLALGTQATLVALQRYNRARMIKRANEELANGATFSPGYRNSFGIDETAYTAYLEQRDKLEVTQELAPFTR